jgi:RNA polymerase sigma-70 factor (ECF subfamily)
MPEDIYIGDLAKKAKSGDKTAFSALYQIFHKPVLGLSRYLVGREGAEDVAQDVFQNALNYIHTLQEPDKFGPWIMRITRNCCNKWKLRDNPKLRQEQLEDVSGCQAIDTYCLSDTRILIASLLNRLPVEFRIIVYLHYIEGLSAIEIGLSLNIALSTVKWRIHRGLALCKQQILKGE